ncbi:MAG: M20/M25/M40 family metallo-hydrolase [Longimicrobiales bacterium]
MILSGGRGEGPAGPAARAGGAASPLAEPAAEVEEGWCETRVGDGTGITLLPGLTTGITDARFLHAAGIPSYGVSGLLLDEGDGRAHGQDERIRVSDYYAGVEFYDRFMKALAGH